MTACNCESSFCTHGRCDHGGCDRIPIGDHMMYIGDVCRACAEVALRNNGAQYVTLADNDFCTWRPEFDARDERADVMRHSTLAEASARGSEFAIGWVSRSNPRGVD
jgi:hypothetical protein